MWKYFYNPNFWRFTWSFRDVGPKSWLVSLVLALIFLKFKTLIQRRILAFIGFTFLMEYVSSDDEWTALLSTETNSPWYHLGTPFLFFFLLQIYKDSLFTGRRRIFFWFLITSFFAFTVLNALYGDGFYNFPSKAVGTYSTTGIMITIAYFIHMLRRLEVEYLERDPLFWVSSGFLVYYSGSFLMWAGISFYILDEAFFFSVYRIVNVLTILLNILLLIALFLPPTPTINTTLNDDKP